MLEFDLDWRRGDFHLHAQARQTARVTGIRGPSGAGKSSLLGLIAGLARPDSGRILLDGRVLVDTARRLWLPPERRHIGLVFQDARLFPHLSVAANLRYGLACRAPAARRFDEAGIIDLLELGTLLARRPGRLSGGEQRRVALGRALLQSPVLLLLDEPLAGLDAERRAQILPFLARIRDSLALPMLYVSHQADEVDFLTDVSWQCRDGRLISPAGGAIIPPSPTDTPIPP